MWASKLTIVKALFLLNPWKLNTNCAGDDFRRDIDICLLANCLIFCLDFRSIPDLEHSDMSPSGIGGVSWSSRLPLRSRRRTYIGIFLEPACDLHCRCSAKSRGTVSTPFLNRASGLNSSDFIRSWIRAWFAIFSETVSLLTLLKILEWQCSLAGQLAHFSRSKETLTAPVA